MYGGHLRFRTGAGEFDFARGVRAMNRLCRYLRGGDPSSWQAPTWLEGLRDRVINLRDSVARMARVLALRKSSTAASAAMWSSISTETHGCAESLLQRWRRVPPADAGPTQWSHFPRYPL